MHHRETGECRLDSNHSKQATLIGLCEHRDESSGRKNKNSSNNGITMKCSRNSSLVRTKL
jgi:hypothetical protein